MIRLLHGTILALALIIAVPQDHAAQDPRPMRDRDPVIFSSVQEAKPALDSLAEKLILDPKAAAYILVYGGRRSCANETNIIARLFMDYIVNERKVDVLRIVMVDGGFRSETSFEFVTVLPGDPDPKPAPTVNEKDIEVLGKNHPKCPQYSDATIFQQVLPVLREKTRVPVRLPTDLQAFESTPSLYAIVEAASPSRYELEIAFTPDCNGGGPCHFGSVAGQVIKRGQRRPRGKPVKLARGIVGYFIDSTCGANCSDSTLSWDQDGYRYSVGAKAGSAEHQIKVANSAIRNKDVSKPGRISK